VTPGARQDADAMTSDTFGQRGASVLARLRAGASIADAARAEGLSARTVSRWLARGRANPAGGYGRFAADADAAARVRALPVAVAPSMDADELVGVLEVAARGGNVTAAKYLLDRLDRHREAAPAPTGGILDELEARRARR
jgi:hypothetical protein